MRSLNLPVTRSLPLWLPIAIFVSFVLLPQPSARGGGWWSSIDLDRRELLSGELLELSSQVFFDARNGLDAMEQARNGAVTYHAYLLIEWDEAVLDMALRHDFRPGWWRTPARALSLGEVALDKWDSNIAWARAAFEVPHIDPGRYSIMFCDLGCEHPLADVIPTSVRIFDADGFARHLDRQIDGVVRQSGADRDRIRGLEQKLAAAPTEDEFYDLYSDLLNRTSELDDRVEGLSIRPDRSGVSWPWLLVTAVAATVLSRLMSRRRDRPLRPPPVEPTESAGATDDVIERDLAGVS
ncbi:MAG: hypothetical protein ACRDKF_16760 [Actinomycetota bacterium]